MEIEDLFHLAQFNPSDEQKEAIKNTKGPLFLIAGPGSGKTRVLLWRTVNLIVFKNVPPEKIFLSTFTEKAAKQLIDGLNSILGMVTNINGIPYDITKMYIGTIHSICQRILGDRRFTKDRSRRKIPNLIDALDQYFLVNSAYYWKGLEEYLNLEEEAFRSLMSHYFNKKKNNRHETALSLISIFNRFSEENLPVNKIKNLAKESGNQHLLYVANAYELYISCLAMNPNQKRVDFSLLQQEALNLLKESEHTSHEFDHIIIDEYQDTNSVQEEIIFHLSKGSKNICVVGDDDQALYRFRGATVENFVQFPERCRNFLNTSPTEIKLNINYRSKKAIVEYYSEFINKVDWKREAGKGYYRQFDKGIVANDKSNNKAVLLSSHDTPLNVAKEIAEFVRNLIDEEKVADPNQIAFLFPAMKNNINVKRMKKALEDLDIKVYAPRAGRFLDVEEAKAIFGILVKVFGRPKVEEYGGDYHRFQEWLTEATLYAESIINGDRNLSAFIDSKHHEVEVCKEDYKRLLETVEHESWNLSDNYNPDIHKRILYKTPMINENTKKGLGSTILDKIAKERLSQGNPFTLNYIINRATSLDWSVLDLFYRVCGFSHFRYLINLAEDGNDEGPICNFSLISQYLSRFMEQTQIVLTGAFLNENKFVNSFFGRFLFSMYRLGESEYEYEDNPFPKGRVQFLTIHQSKGLEFPYVILGVPGKKFNNISRNEEIVRPFLSRKGEPLSKMPIFDLMRLFYVALSRAEDVLVIANPRGPGTYTDESFKKMHTEKNFPTLDKIDSVILPRVKTKKEDLPKVYSYTGDYLYYLKCARNYMFFRKYGFVPSRSQTMFFGNLVHKTIEDLHNKIISDRGEVND